MKKVTQAQRTFVNKVFTNLIGIETFEEEGFMKEENREMNTYHLRNDMIDMGNYINHTDYIKKGSVKITQLWHGRKTMTLIVYGKKAFLVRRNTFVRMNGLTVKIPKSWGKGLVKATIA